MTNRLLRGSLIAALGAGAALTALPAGASAADPAWRCTATPLSGTLLGQQLPLPTAGDANAECANDSATLPTVALPAPLDSLLRINLLNGNTAARDGAVFAGAGLADVSVGSLPIPLPQIALPPELTRIEVGKAALQGILPAPVLAALPDVPLATVDLTPAINALNSLPSRNLLGAQALYSNVTGVCTDGAPSVTGASRVLGAQVLGLDVDPNRAVDTSVNLIDTTTIALSQLNLQLANVTLLGGAVNLITPTQILQGLLGQLPAIAIPAQVAQVKLTPSSTEVVNGVTVQRALRAQISLAGQSIADLSIGQAAVGPGSIDCAPPASAPQAALECTRRNLTLIDVVRRGPRVKLLGAADPSLAGKTARITFQATKKVVAKARIRKDGAFSAFAPLPARKVRGTNRARYIARVGKEKSLNLKLQRRMLINSVRSSDGEVTITGRIVKPLGSPVRRVTLKRRVSCEKYEVVKRFKPSKSGRFKVTAPAPEGEKVGVYRLQTSVRNNVGNDKVFPTFTLPRAVNL